MTTSLPATYLGLALAAGILFAAVDRLGLRNKHLSNGLSVGLVLIVQVIARRYSLSDVSDNRATLYGIIFIAIAVLAGAGLSKILRNVHRGP
jgi:hypothetical protein